jgi:hypothetical protein
MRHSSKVVELDDYRPIWISARIKMSCCSKEYISVFPYFRRTLECSSCANMSKFDVLEYFGEK